MVDTSPDVVSNVVLGRDYCAYTFVHIISGPFFVETAPNPSLLTVALMKFWHAVDALYM
jgi:hypothetical protein